MQNQPVRILFTSDALKSLHTDRPVQSILRAASQQQILALHTAAEITDPATLEILQSLSNVGLPVSTLPTAHPADYLVYADQEAGTNKSAEITPLGYESFVRYVQKMV